MSRIPEYPKPLAGPDVSRCEKAQEVGKNHSKNHIILKIRLYFLIEIKIDYMYKLKRF